MLPRSDETNLPSINLLDFSDEMLVAIFKCLQDSRDIQKLSQTCTRIHGICHDMLLDTLYSRSLAFERWLQKEQKQLTINSQHFNKKYQVSLFHRPDKPGWMDFSDPYFYP